MISLSKENIFYVYVYLDPRKPGDYVYGEYHFDYEPFYVGKGNGNRAYGHLNGNKYNPHFHNKIKKIQKITGQDPIVVLYREQLFENIAMEFEPHMIKTIGRKDLKLGPLCNLTNGGDGVSGHITSDETKRKQSEKKKGWVPSNEWKMKQSKAQKGDNNHFFGKHHTDETKTIISEKKKGKPAWNKGLTKDTDERVAKYTNTRYGVARGRD